MGYFYFYFNVTMIEIPNKADWTSGGGLMTWQDSKGTPDPSLAWPRCRRGEVWGRESLAGSGGQQGRYV